MKINYLTSLLSTLPPTQLYSSSVGQKHENLVVNDLIGKGCHVFVHATPNSPFDIVAITPNGDVEFLEVRTGAFRYGGVTCPRTKREEWITGYALVLHDGTIHYISLSDIPKAPKGKKRSAVRLPTSYI